MNKHELQVELDVLRLNIRDGIQTITFSSDGWANMYGAVELTSVAHHNSILSKIRLIEALEDEMTWRIADAFFGEKRTQVIPKKIENPLFYEAQIDMKAPDIRFRILHAFRDAAYYLVREYYPNIPNDIFFRANDFCLKIIFSMREHAVSPNEKEY